MSCYLQKIILFLGYTPPILEKHKMLGERLKAFRIENEVSQKELSLKIGIGLNTYRGLENEGGKILKSTEIKILRFFACLT